MTLIHPTAILYGRVAIGSRSLVEQSVVLGHPSAAAVNAMLDRIDQYESLHKFYTAATCHETSVGEHAIIRSNTVIYENVVIGRGFDCGHGVIVREGSRIGEFVYMKNNAEVMKGVTIGDGCRIGGVIADEVEIGRNASSFGIVTHPYREYLPPSRSPSSAGHPTLESPVVDEGAIIGRGAVIAGAITIGAGAVIAANAVVTHDVPPMGRIRAPRSLLV
jgi:acetyltransferase-like isoleucine patch superfamily enzyme